HVVVVGVCGHPLVVDIPIALGRFAAGFQHCREHTRTRLAVGHVVVDLRDHPSVGIGFGDERTVVRPVDVEHREGIAHLTIHVDLAANLDQRLHHSITSRFSRVRSGTLASPVARSASNVALAKFTVVRVLPDECVQMSSMPASSSTDRAVSPAASPSPRGAGRSSTSTLPAFPSVRSATVWGRPQPHSHEPQPRETWTMLSLAISMAFWIADPT